jgi:hypothetical protein
MRRILRRVEIGVGKLSGSYGGASRVFRAQKVFQGSERPYAVLEAWLKQLGLMVTGIA